MPLSILQYTYVIQSTAKLLPDLTCYTTDMQRRLAARAIIFKDGKLLSVRIKNQKTGHINDYWCGVGGGVEEHEDIMSAIHREVIEETGVEPVVGDLLYIQQFNHDDRDHLEFFFNITNVEDFENVKIEETTHGAVELYELEYIDPRGANMLPKFLTERDIAADIASGKTKIFTYL